MMKKYFTDGLIQIAIVLSLMRTDLNDYLNNQVDTFTQENLEVHGTIHGPTSAYTQANFHHSRFYHHGGSGDYGITTHPKNIDQALSNTILSDLHALGNLRQQYYSAVIPTSIEAYIVGEHETPGLWDSETESHSVPAVNMTGVPSLSISSNNDSSSTAVESEVSFGETTTGESFSESNSNYGSELTLEDMDLIDILWRQDMDMGVTKDTFSATLRKELEKEEQELKVKVEEGEALPMTELPSLVTTADEDENITYIVDNETGELVPAPPGTILPESQPMETESGLGEEQGQLLEEAISILQAEAEPEGSAGAVVLGQIVVQPPPQHHSQSVVDMVNANVSRNDIDALVENMAQLNGLTYSRQASMEARWHDVEGLITGGGVEPPVGAGEDADDFTAATALIQDASLAIIGRQGNNLNLTEPMPPPGEDILSLNLNESQMLINLTADIPTLFPNNTMVTAASAASLASHHLGNHGDDNNASSLLSDILGEVNDLNNISFPTQIDSTTEFQPIKYEDSDSAVGGSLGSPGSSDMDYGDSRSNITSPFDGLEGATGGSDDSSSSSKHVVKYDPSDYSSYSTLDWEHTQIQASNSSGESNDSTDLGFTPANPRHVVHNHTYPLQPGQEPRESKTYPTSSHHSSRGSMLDKKALGHNKDQKKAKALKIPFTTAEIIHSPVEMFNDMMTKYKLTDPQLQLIKDIRRRGKNKVAAQNCRKRKMEVIDTLDDTVQQMRNERDAAARRKSQMERERDRLRDKYNTLYRDVFHSLRDEEGRPYDPTEYTLQHTADGNVFLMPRNNQTAAATGAGTAGEDPELKRGRKRKGSKK